MAQKTIFITGCDSGIGEATALYFLKKGWRVIATYKEKKNIKSSTKTSLHLYADVTDMVSIENAYAKGIDAFGTIDVLVNNAGYGLVGAFEDIPPQQIQKQFDVNLFGLMNTSRVFLPHFRSNNFGVIINVSSMFGRISMPFFSIYTASKWAVEGFSEALLQEVSDYRIDIKLIEPGTIKTDFFKNIVKAENKNNNTKVYVNRYNNFMATILKKSEQGEAPDMVAERIYKAATGGYRFRYLVDFTAKLLVTMHIFNPFFIFRKIIRIAIG